MTLPDDSGLSPLQRMIPGIYRLFQLPACLGGPQPRWTDSLPRSLAFAPSSKFEDAPDELSAGPSKIMAQAEGD